MASAVSGCAGTFAGTAEPVATVAPLCTLKVVCISSADEFTSETAEDIEKNNLAGKAMCGERWAKCRKNATRKPAAPKQPPQSKPATKPAPAAPLRPTYADDGEPKMI